jgi:signal transduction histidine kinase
MIIKDNGTTAAQPLVKSVGYGLRNMHMRAAKIKANIEINTINGYMVKLTMGKM